jgi:phospholipase/carboxylesterase
LNLPEAIEIAPAASPKGSVIWLHGLGADGHDFEPIVAELRLPDSLALRFVFPHAPMRPVTLNGGMTMRAWYDILSLDRNGPQDEKGIRDSAAILAALVEKEHGRGIAYENIVVAGFSQGGAIALQFALRFAPPLAGLMALSTWLPLSASLQAEVIENEQAQSRDLPLFLAHGQFDPMLPIALGEESRSTLTNMGYTVEWHAYPMEHSVCAEEIEDIRSWLLGVYSLP